MALIFQWLGAYNREMGVRERVPVEIDAALRRGAVVVTGNQRAARTLRYEVDRRNRELGLGSWEPPKVLAWDAWTEELWRELVLGGGASLLLLNRVQEHAVWRAVLEADEELASLRTVESLAEMAAEAWGWLCRYNGRERLRGAGMSSDTRAFQRWAVMFERTCRAEGFLTRAGLESTLSEAVGKIRVGGAGAEGVAAAAAGVALVGFDALTPAQMGLVEALRRVAASVEELPIRVGAESRLLVAAKDEAGELGIAARWVRSFLETRPEARVAVVVPGLEAQRAEVDRVFREVLAPELEDIGAPEEVGPYEFSLGVPLAETAMVRVALDLLRWAAGPLPMERVSGLLLSPYFCMRARELGVRAEFDGFELRRTRMLRPEVSLEWMIRMVGQSKRREELGRLPEVLRGMLRVAGRLGFGGGVDSPGSGLEIRRSYAEWAEAIRELLEVARWGKGSGEDSVEFQTRRRWESGLDELATLDFDGERVEFGQALAGVERIARQTVFAPESREAPVQVMGPLEAAGGSFDAVWFLRGGEKTWPMAIGGSPLLAWPLRRELGMPGTDVAEDTAAAQRMTERIAESAGTVVFSYARETAEGRQRVSAVVGGLGLAEAGVAELVGSATERETVAVEEVEDRERVRALPDEVIHGGARILELQASCGFRAFAEQRMGSTELEDVTLGMDARESGTVVHRVLEYFWDEVKTQSALKAMSDAEREELLDACIVRALGRAAELGESAWDAAYVEMQYERLQRLLRPWLWLEMERSPFEVKESEKEMKEARVGPLRLSVRMDRVDVVDGGEVLIDYKTGVASPTDWLTERPSAPQLPLYAILSNAETLQGVAFGLVRAGEGRELKGYAVREGVLPSRMKMKAASLEEQLEEWRGVLSGLAEEFASGVARVDPKEYPATCARCGQRMVCRLDVTLLEDDEEENGEASGERSGEVERG